MIGVFLATPQSPGSNATVSTAATTENAPPQVTLPVKKRC
jgi:hypothetical protein